MQKTAWGDDVFNLRGSSVCNAYIHPGMVQSAFDGSMEGLPS